MRCNSAGEVNTNQESGRSEVKSRLILAETREGRTRLPRVIISMVQQKQVDWSQGKVSNQMRYGTF
jgi:hypothetical protein